MRQVGLGAFLGVNGRYWVAPALGIGVSFGESYSSATLVGASSADFTTLATFGAIDATFVL